MPEPVVVYDGLLSMHYGFAYLHTEPDGDFSADLDVARAGHRNGLCTAGVPHQLSMMTGTHSGDVRFRIEWTYAPPPLGDEWEDVVEVSVDVLTTEGTLAAFEDFHELALPLTGPHRARYCAAGMDLADRELDEEPGDEIPIEPDRYLLQLWPVAMAPDAIVREHSERARYWHSVAQSTPAPRPEQRSMLSEVTATQRLFRFDGGDEGEVDPFDLLDDSGATGEVLHALSRAAPAQRRRAGRFFALAAAMIAGLADHPEVATALAALDTGRPLPSPFDDFTALLGRPWPTWHDEYPPVAGLMGWWLDEPYAPTRSTLAAAAIHTAADPDTLRAASGAYTYAAAAFRGYEGSLLLAFRHWREAERWGGDPR